MHSTVHIVRTLNIVYSIFGIVFSGASKAISQALRRVWTLCAHVTCARDGCAITNLAANSTLQTQRNLKGHRPAWSLISIRREGGLKKEKRKERKGW